MQVWAVAWLLGHVASQVQDSVSAVRGMMERCIAAHQLVTRGRAGKCGNAGARCYAHTMLDMLDMLSISAEKGKGSADET